MNNKTIFKALILMALNTFQLQSFDAADTSKFEQVFIMGLHGNITSALSFIDTLNNEILTERQAEIKQKFYSRFRDKNEVYDFKTKVADVISIMKRYQTYWRNVLLDNTKLSREDSSLTGWIIKFLRSNYNSVKNKPADEMNENFTQYLQDYLMTKGIYAATGKTGMFFDLLMHTKETEVIYQVTTPEDTIKVKVVFMEEILSNGWEDYATMGRYYPGGWATNEALFCLKESYDLESENFLVSYLKHEGKHFADYKKYPKLTGADLEYRAKLVELSSANKNLYGLIRFFINNSKYDRQNPHGFANFCVIRDLSKKIFGVDNITDIEKWKTVSIEVINNKAVVLLKENTKDLEKAGAETVTEFIK